LFGFFVAGRNVMIPGHHRLSLTKRNLIAYVHFYFDLSHRAEPPAGPVALVAAFAVIGGSIAVLVRLG
jgi:hypothetical protein